MEVVLNVFFIEDDWMNWCVVKDMLDVVGVMMIEVDSVECGLLILEE